MFLKHSITKDLNIDKGDSYMEVINGSMTIENIPVHLDWVDFCLDEQFGYPLTPTNFTIGKHEEDFTDDSNPELDIFLNQFSHKGDSI